MRALQVLGMAEVQRLRRRVRRLLAMERIFPADAQYITERLDQIEARIATMHEVDEQGKEVQ
jgi:hypothetical protein